MCFKGWCWTTYKPGNLGWWKKYDWYRGRRPQRTHFILQSCFFFTFPLFPSSKYHFGFSHFLRTSKVTIAGNEVVCVCSVAQLCASLCDPMDYCPPGSSVHGIFQARILEWVDISFSRGSSWPRDRTHVSCVSCIAGRFLTHWAIKFSSGGFPIQSFTVRICRSFVYVCH